MEQPTRIPVIPASPAEHVVCEVRREQTETGVKITGATRLSWGDIEREPVLVEVEINPETGNRQVFTSDSRRAFEVGI